MARVTETGTSTNVISDNFEVRRAEEKTFDVCVRIADLSALKDLNPFSQENINDSNFDQNTQNADSNTQTVHMGSSPKTYSKFDRKKNGPPVVLSLFSNCFNTGPSFQLGGWGGSTREVHHYHSGNTQTVNMGKTDEQKKKEEEEAARKRDGIISVVISFVFTILIGKLVCNLDDNWANKNELKFYKNQLKVTYKTQNKPENTPLKIIITRTEQMVKRKFIRDIFRLNLAISGLFFSAITAIGAYGRLRCLRKTGMFALVGVGLGFAFQGSISFFGSRDRRDRNAIQKQYNILRQTSI